MKLSRTVQKAFFAALVLLAPVMGQATTTWTFNFTDNCVAGTYGCGDWDDYRVYTDTTGTDTVTVKSYIASDGQNIAQGQVNAWTGLGAKKTYEPEAYPSHALDNDYNEYEAILFDFGEGNLVSLNSVSVGWSYNDSDISVLALTGAPSDITSLQWNQLLANGWDDIAHMANVADWPGSTGTFNPGDTVYSRYWLVGAYNPLLNPSGTVVGSNNTWGADFFKVSAISGTVYHDNGGGGSVPEPATILLMTLGLGFMGTRRKFLG